MKSVWWVLVVVVILVLSGVITFLVHCKGSTPEAQASAAQADGTCTAAPKARTPKNLAPAEHGDAKDLARARAEGQAQFEKMRQSMIQEEMEKMAAKRADLIADIEHIVRQLNNKKDCLEICKRAARETSDQHIFRQAESDRKLNETAIADLDRQWRQKIAALEKIPPR